MKEITIGIIAEGGGDCVVIGSLLSAYVKTLNLKNCAIHFKGIQPYVDNTSRSEYSEGGWEQIYKWCISNPPDARSEVFFGVPLFADGMDEHNCSALIVHMDADICEAIGDKTSVVPVPKAGASASVRGKFIADVLGEWLWPEGFNIDSRHIIAPAVESIEAWLVAGLCEEDIAPELDQDIQRRLAELDYSVVRRRPVPKNIKKTDKSARNFRKIAEHASPNISRIADRCPHFRAAAIKTETFIRSELQAS